MPTTLPGPLFIVYSKKKIEDLLNFIVFKNVSHIRLFWLTLRFGVRTQFGSEIFRIAQNGCGAHPASCAVGTGALCFLGEQRPGPAFDYTPPSSSETKERADLVPSWPVMGRTLLLRCRTRQQPSYTDAQPLRLNTCLDKVGRCDEDGAFVYLLVP